MTKSVPALSDITIIIVTYNSAHCLPALQPLLRRCPHVHVFDNASMDGTPHLIRRSLAHVKVTDHPQNLGFGAANNRALAQVQTPFALLLNPDCELDPEQLQGLRAAADQFQDAAVVAPQLVDGRDRAEVNYRWPSIYWVSKGPGAEGPACVGFVCGAAMLLRMEAFAQTGFFDEQFYLYYEDDDLCVRLLRAGLPMIIVPAIRAVHRSRGSVKAGAPWRSEYWRGYHHAQSKLTFAAKHQSGQGAGALRTKLIWQTALALPLRVAVFSPRLIGRMWGRIRGALHWRPTGRLS